MINQTLPTNINTYKHAHFGARLKSAREALGIDRKEVASQLRLHEQVITMIEHGEFSSDLPLTFIRGYIRNYSKLMGLPEKELNDALELLKPQPETTESEQASAPAAQVTASGSASATSKISMPVNIGNFFMQLFTYLLAITLIGLVGIWWHTHKSEVRTNDTLATTQDSVTATPPTPEKITATPAEEKPQDIAENTATPAAANNTDTALPNAENPDSQTPPTAMDNATTPDAAANSTPSADNAKTAETTSGSVVADKTSPAITADQTSTATPTKSIFPLSRGDKTPVANIVTGYSAFLWLTNLVLFLIILTASLRIFATQPLSHRMASIRTTNTSHANFNFSNILKLTDKFKLNKTMQLIAVLAVTVSLVIFGIVRWYEHRTTGTMLADAAKSADVSQAQEQADLSPITTDLETLAPTPTLNVNNTLMTNFKSYALYSMVNQLDSYINQAADTKFNLTDKSTPIGQFIPYKKKYRKHRQQAINNSNTNSSNSNNNSNDNATYHHNENNSYGNSAPPFYYQQQYGVSGQ